MNNNHKQLMRLENRINKLAELTEKYSTTDPDACMNKARQIAEGICRHTIIKHGIKQPENVPEKLDLMIQCLKKPGKEYGEVMDSPTLGNLYILQNYGNMGTHFKGKTLTNQDIQPALSALRNLLDWFSKENSLSKFSIEKGMLAQGGLDITEIESKSQAQINSIKAIKENQSESTKTKNQLSDYDFSNSSSKKASKRINAAKTTTQHSEEHIHCNPKKYHLQQIHVPSTNSSNLLQHRFSRILITIIVAVAFVFLVSTINPIRSKQPLWLVPTNYISVREDTQLYSSPTQTSALNIVIPAGTSFLNTGVFTEDAEGTKWIAVEYENNIHYWVPASNIESLLMATYTQIEGAVPLDYPNTNNSHFKTIRKTPLYEDIDPHSKVGIVLMDVPKDVVFYNNDITTQTFDGDVYWKGSYYNATGYIDEEDIEWLYTYT